MEQRPLRVRIIGQQNNFTHVLSTNLQHWGYEVMFSADISEETRRKEHLPLYTLAEWQADVLLYNLDDMVNTTGSYSSLAIFQSLKESGRLVIVLSNRSVSRRTLEQMGAIALVQKPFEIERLLRYLHVLQQLLFACVPEDVSKNTPGTRNVMRVLVADDNESIVQIVQEYLMQNRETGFEVAIAADGLDALEQCLHWQPDCVVTDLLMPWMNGYQVMRCLALAGLPRPTPAFVVMSALTHVEVPSSTSYMAGKAVVYINKPFTSSHLLTAIQQVCMV